MFLIKVCFSKFESFVQQCFVPPAGYPVIRPDRYPKNESGYPTGYKKAEYLVQPTPYSPYWS